MTLIAALGLVRLVLCVVSVPFALRGRYWLLTGLLILGAVAALVTVLGMPRETASVIATPLYALLALHTLDITRRRHPARTK